jgi:hypothetical protein
MSEQIELSIEKPLKNETDISLLVNKEVDIDQVTANTEHKGGNSFNIPHHSRTAYRQKRRLKRGHPVVSSHEGDIQEADDR